MAALRTALPKLVSAPRPAQRTFSAIARSSLAARPAPSLLASARRSYADSHGATASGLSREEIMGRVNEILRTFEKVQADKVSPTASFTGDLGLDSLDAVEVVMAIEEEFTLEISDADADKIDSVSKAIDYVAAQPDAM